MKKTISFLLALAMLLSFCACGSGNKEPENAVRTITDGLGREVEVPAEVKTIVTLGNASRMAAYLGLADRMITVANGDLSESVVMAYGYYNHDMWSSLPIAASGGYGEINPEVIIEADPDVILCTYEEDIVANIEEQLGRKVVAAPQGTLFGEDYELALRVFGDACGVKDRAEEVINYIHSCLEDLDNRTKGLGDDVKPSVLCAAATFKGGHGIEGVYANNAVLAAVNAKDVTIGYIDAQKGVEVDKEQIIAWDPQVLIFDASNIGLIKNQYAEDQNLFESLQAVKNGKLYQWPNSTSNYTNVEIPIVNAYYAGSLMFPEAFADVDFDAKAEEVFRFFLGHEGYLKVLNDAGMGYGTVSLK
ncbi:MAG: ABC transporter substrate-binding protein [Firmicutes bacterium]|nr:ABC transporter substrate-binding protein [Bacillota bacterium]